MSLLASLSWNQLVEHLAALRASYGDDGPAEQVARLVHELHVHQIELEMQNRELRQAQSALEESRARYVELYDEAPVGYVTFDSHGLIAQINLTGAALLGKERDQLVGAPFVGAARVSGASAFFAHLTKVFRGGRGGELVLDVRPRSAPMTWQLTTVPRFGPGGAVLDCRAAIEDVTSRSRAESEKQALLEREHVAREQAESANRMKDQFLAIVSHELRTPLTPLLGWTRILSLRPDDAALVTRGTQVMQRNGEALARIVDDILDVSRIVNGKLSIEARKCDIEAVVRSAVELARSAANAKGVVLRESIAADCALIGDPQRLQQVVWNLLSNAIKFTSSGRQIDVVLERQAGTVRLIVRDDGRGIDPAVLPYVFDKFRQEDSSSIRKHGGLGLGLAIARHIVEAHGGRIAADSQGLGKGATFIVDLPVRPTSVAPPPLRSSVDVLDGLPTDLEDVKILLVDDEIDALDMVSSVLESRGAVVRTASSAAGAMAEMASFAPDAIVSDVAMPDEDGLSLIRRVRALPSSTATVPAIALTALARPEDVSDALSAGFTRHLTKPIDLEVLAATISNVVAQGATTVL